MNLTSPFRNLSYQISYVPSPVRTQGRPWPKHGTMTRCVSPAAVAAPAAMMVTFEWPPWWTPSPQPEVVRVGVVPLVGPEGRSRRQGRWARVAGSEVKTDVGEAAAMTAGCIRWCTPGPARSGSPLSARAAGARLCSLHQHKAMRV
jgi:hypothetical protein